MTEEQIGTPALKLVPARMEGNTGEADFIELWDGFMVVGHVMVSDLKSALKDAAPL